MFDKRAQLKELIDDVSLRNECLRQNVDELAMVNQWLGGQRVYINAIETIYKKYAPLFHQTSLSIVDVGCGNGDLLRTLSAWSTQKEIALTLKGIDANAFIIDHAQKKSQNFPHIQYEPMNVLSSDFLAQEWDVVSLNTFCHHFNEVDLIALLSQLAKNTKLAIIINDLHRHWFAYYGIKLLTRIFPCSYLIKHDGPLSVLRAFQKTELTGLLTSLNYPFQIRWAWAFRWEAIIWCKSPKGGLL